VAVKELLMFSAILNVLTGKQYTGLKMTAFWDVAP
jgi:hypothetical protein